MVIFEEIPFKGKIYLLIRAKLFSEFENHLKKFPGIKWSVKHACYYIISQTDGQTSALRAHIEELGLVVHYSKHKPSEQKIKNIEKTALDPNYQELLEKYLNYLTVLRLSERTIITYGQGVKEYLRFVNHMPFEDFSNRSIEAFIKYTLQTRMLAIASHRVLISALKHFARFAPELTIDELELVRPKRVKRLPVVLSKEEVIDLLRATRNLKHRAVLALLYSSGLRISELLSLQLRDIDVDRKQLFVRCAKGRKDRMVVLAESMIPLLRNYYMTYQPKYYFVEGPKRGQRYSDSSVRQFLKRSCQLARIYKKVSPHTLRHSYATHMLENGIDIRYIQTLLGHSRPETTMIYTHVTRKDLNAIKSPLDVTLSSLHQKDKENEFLFLSQNF